MRVLQPQCEGYVSHYADLSLQVAVLSTQLSSSSLHTNVLNELRAIERKMGLVLTLFKASVWAIVMQQSDVQDEAWDTTSTDAPDARRPTW